MKFTKDKFENQRIIMELAAKKLEAVLRNSQACLIKGIGFLPPHEYHWRLRGAIKLLRNPPTKNKGMRG